MPKQFQSIISNTLVLFVVIILAVWFGIKLGESSKARCKSMVSSFNETVSASRAGLPTMASTRTYYNGDRDSVTARLDQTDFAERLFGSMMVEIFTIKPGTIQKQASLGRNASTRPLVVEIIEDDDPTYVGELLEN